MKLVTIIILAAATACSLMAKVDKTPEVIYCKGISLPPTVNSPARVDVSLKL